MTLDHSIINIKSQLTSLQILPLNHHQDYSSSNKHNETSNNLQSAVTDAGGGLSAAVHNSAGAGKCLQLLLSQRQTGFKIKGQSIAGASAAPVSEVNNWPSSSSYASPTANALRALTVMQAARIRGALAILSHLLLFVLTEGKDIDRYDGDDRRLLASFQGPDDSDILNRIDLLKKHLLVSAADNKAVQHREKGNSSKQQHHFVEHRAKLVPPPPPSSQVEMTSQPTGAAAAILHKRPTSSSSSSTEQFQNSAFSSRTPQQRHQ